MRALKRWIRNWLSNDYQEAEPIYDNRKDMYANKVGTATISGSPLNTERALSLQVMYARGGTIIETRTYNQQKGESNTTLYVIHSDKDLGQEISKIITMEALKQ